MNIEQIKQDENFLCGIELQEHHFKCYLLFQGVEYLKYCAFHNEVLIFEGNDYRPSPLYPGYDSLESMCGILSFLTVKGGDTDGSYFKDYSNEQIAWRDSYECEQLGNLLSDFNYVNEKDAESIEYNAQAKEQLKAAFIQP